MPAEEGVAEELARAVEEEFLSGEGTAESIDAAAATTPPEAEPMKVLQSIWDASAVATVARGDLRFMPFSEGVDLSKLAELRTLKGHSGIVRCGVHCTFVMMCLRRRSGALPCFRAGGASCLGRETARSRCGTWRPVDAWRRWKGTRVACVAASTFCSTFVMMRLRRRS